MCRITWVAQEDDFADAVLYELQDSGANHVSRITDLELEPSHWGLHSSNIVIIDLQSVGPLLAKVLGEVTQLHPETEIIAISPRQRQAPVDILAQFGVEEILIRPSSDQEVCAILAQLRMMIRSHDSLLALQEKLRQEMRQNQIVTKSRAMREILQRMPSLWFSTATVLLVGETGTGKELIARAIHYLGPRRSKPFITLDCGTLPEHLIENELFGHARGAYTTANSSYGGLIREANGGTLFLDEVEALPLSAQTKFLRLLQEQQYRPLGQPKYINVDLHIIAATNQNLAAAVAQHNFREDLYYRLDGAKIFIPPLRERKADVLALVDYFLKKHNLAGADTAPRIPAALLHTWLEYAWPGNVRELENKVRMWLADSKTEFSHQTPLAPATLPLRTLAEVRQEALRSCDSNYLQDLLQQFKGNISAAARMAGIHRKSLSELLKKYGIKVERYRR